MQRGMRGRVSVSAFCCWGYSPFADYSIPTLTRRSGDAMVTSRHESTQRSPYNTAVTTNSHEHSTASGKAKRKASELPPRTYLRKVTFADPLVTKRNSPPIQNSLYDDDDSNEPPGGREVREPKRPRREVKMPSPPCDPMMMTPAVKDMVKAIPESEYQKMVKSIQNLASPDPQTSVSNCSIYSRCAMY